MPESMYKEVMAAIMAAQASIDPVIKSAKNDFFKSNYATLNDVLKAIEGPCHANGLVVVQAADKDGLTTIVCHPQSGEERAWTASFNYDKKGPQAQGACITYLRRYQLCAIFGIPQVDDDAESAMQREPQLKASAFSAVRNAIETADSLERIQEIRNGIPKVSLSDEERKKAMDILERRAAQLSEEETGAYSD